MQKLRTVKAKKMQTPIIEMRKLNIANAKQIKQLRNAKANVRHAQAKNCKNKEMQTLILEMQELGIANAKKCKR